MNPPAPPAGGPPTTAATALAPPLLASPLLAWYFVTAWGSGYLATKVGLQYAPPFTFLTLRFALGIVLLLPLVLWWQRQQPLRWPADRRAWGHLLVAGALMHAANLGGSHSAQYLGMSAGVTALILATQPLVTAFIAGLAMGERLRGAQWLGVLLGLVGVALVVWHKVDVRAITGPALLAVTISLAAVTLGTLYQRHFCPTADLRSTSLIHFVLTFLLMAPLAVAVEGFPVHWAWPLLGSLAFLVIFSSIGAVNALHTLMRRGEATRVTSLLYLTPIIAVVLEWLIFSVLPTALTVIGIAVTCAGVALVAWQPRPSRPPQGPA